MESPTPRPVIFIGPSISFDAARQILPTADFRRPIRRDDLSDIAAGTVVGVVDGVFDESLSVSPTEIREAIGRGVVVYGGASMGALRAAEVAGMIGVGRVYEMYRDGLIERDDEVAVAFDPDSHRCLTEPLVNIRYAIERLVHSASIRAETGADILGVASGLNYRHRSYKNILNTCGVNEEVQPDLLRLLRGFNLKREDAQLVLEAIKADASTAGHNPSVAPATQWPTIGRAARQQEDPLEPMLVWEYGERIQFQAFLNFLKITGQFESIARQALVRLSVGGHLPRRSTDDSAQLPEAVDTPQSLLDFVRLQWGWLSPEEANVTMRDLGLGLSDVGEALEAELNVREVISRLVHDSDASFVRGLRIEMWMHDLTLKREALRFGALQQLAKLGARAGQATEEELDGARRTICRVRRVVQWKDVVLDVGYIGVTVDALDAMCGVLALARRSGGQIIRAMDGMQPHGSPTHRREAWRSAGLPMEPSRKALGSARFTSDSRTAYHHCQVVAKKIGIRRIGLIGELDCLGVHVAQAFGRRVGWSTSFGSGKSQTAEGAKVGSIMEEAEIFCQDAFVPSVAARASYASVRSDERFVCPSDLDLPYDSRYHDDLEMDWLDCVDLIQCRRSLIPSAALLKERVSDDIYYSARLATKQFSSNGLGSGFSLAEAVVHGAAEYVERHAWRLAELAIDNPGAGEPSKVRFVDLTTLPATLRDLVEQYRRAGMTVRLVDITSEIRIPTFFAKVFEDPYQNDNSGSNDGYACHPNPEVAALMALLEAAQMRAGAIAGSREDYSLPARSLGRHERPRPIRPAAQVFWFGNDRRCHPFSETVGFVTDDLVLELEWMVDRIEAAGLKRMVVADLSTPLAEPAKTVRVIIPGLETTNPFYTGPRARATSIRDLLPPLGSEISH